VGSVFWSIRFLLPVCRLSWFLYTLTIKNGHLQNVCSMCIKINKVGKQEVGIWWVVQKCFPRYGAPIWSLWPNIRTLLLWEAFFDPSDSYFLFADLVGFYTHWTYMHIFRYIFLSNYWCQESDIWSQASFRYAILWEAFLDPSDSYFLLSKSPDS
jgi:hypothetical protein